ADASGPNTPRKTDIRATTWVLPGRRRARLQCPVDPKPLAIWIEVHVCLDRNPIGACAQHGWAAQGYLENARVVYVRLGSRAVNLRPGQAAAIPVEEDVEIVGRATHSAIAI